jgi:hypothetical protein
VDRHSEYFAELEGFIQDHRPHGPLTADATTPTWNGYLLTGARPFGITFERWISPLEAELDLLRAAGLNFRCTAIENFWNSPCSTGDGSRGARDGLLS